jgi:hypothetical protein
MLHRSAEIETALQSCHSAIAPTLAEALAPTVNYVIDFAIVMGQQDGHDSEMQVKVLEINPYEPATSACLFSWAINNQTLRGEGGSFEMRMVDQPRCGVVALAVPVVRAQLEDWIKSFEAEK